MAILLFAEAVLQGTTAQHPTRLLVLVLPDCFPCSKQLLVRHAQRATTVPQPLKPRSHAQRARFSHCLGKPFARSAQSAMRAQAQPSLHLQPALQAPMRLPETLPPV